MRIIGPHITSVVRNLREEGWHDLYVRIDEYYCFNGGIRGITEFKKAGISFKTKPNISIKRGH